MYESSYNLDSTSQIASQEEFIPLPPNDIIEDNNISPFNPR